MAFCRRDAHIYRCVSLRRTFFRGLWSFDKFAGYAVRICDLEFELAPDDIPASEEAPRADTVGVRIDAIEEDLRISPLRYFPWLA